MARDRLSEKPAAAFVEDIIAALCDRPAPNPLCWIVCYEDRPLQGAPPHSGEPHLMIFTTQALGKAFIQGRQRYFGPEPLKTVSIDSPATLSQLALAPAHDDRYTSPPCGLILNFNYSNGQFDKSLLPSKMKEGNEKQVATELGFKVTAMEVETGRESKGNQTCPLCGEKLYMQRGGGRIVVGFGDDIFSHLESRGAALEHTAYACRKCGTLICKSCAEKYVCPECGNNTFDRFDLTEVKPSGAVPALKIPAPSLPPIPQFNRVAGPAPSPAQRSASDASTYRPSVSQARAAGRPGLMLFGLPVGAYIIAGAALLVVFIAFSSRPRSANLPASSTATSTAVTVPTVTPLPPPILIDGPDTWTLTQISYADVVRIPDVRTLSAPEGSQLLSAAFVCDTNKNPLTIQNPDASNVLEAYAPGGIADVFVTDESGARYPVPLISVFFADDEAKAFFLTAVVPGPSDNYMLHFFSLQPIRLRVTVEIVSASLTREAADVPPALPNTAPATPTSLPAPKQVILEGSESSGMDVSFSPLGTYIASDGSEGKVRTWLVSSGDIFMDYDTQSSYCCSDFSYSPDETLLAVADTVDGRMFIFDVQSGSMLGKLALGRPDEVEFSPDGKWLAAGSQGSGTAVWNMDGSSRTGVFDTEPVLIESEDNFFTCLQFSPDSKILAFGEGYGGTGVWDVPAGKLIRTLAGDCWAPDSMNFSPDGKFLSFGSPEAIQTWSVESGELHEEFYHGLDLVNNMSAFHPGGKIIAITHIEPGRSTIELWLYRRGQKIMDLTGQSGAIMSLDFSPDGMMLVSGSFGYSDPNQVVIWNLEELLSSLD